MVLERIILRPLIGEPIISVVMVTIGLSSILQGLTHIIWSPDYRSFPEIFPPEPLDIGFAFTRPRQHRDAGDEGSAQQRVVVIGDADFISNTYLGNGGNIDLGLSLFNWLNHDDAFITITARTAGDVNLELGKVAQIVIGFGFLFGMPLLLLGSGLAIWWRRRNR